MRRTQNSLLAPISALVALELEGFVGLFHMLSGPGVQVTPQRVSSVSASPTGANAGAGTVVFTRPDRPEAASLRGGPDAALAAAIEGAGQQVDMAAYDFNLWSIRDALLSVAQRGVSVRVVAESDNLDRPEFQDLIEAGIPVVGDQRQGLMHHKFVVIDGYEVWTGSMNFTLNGAYRNDNNLLRLRSTRLAADYLAEFEEMFVEHHFGADVGALTPYPQVSLDGTPVEVYFSPDDHPLARLLALLDQAQHEVLFLAFNLTQDDLAERLIRLHEQGITVRGVFEAQQVAYSQGNDYRRLREAGLAVRLDGNPHNMHHKVFVIDGRWVVTGSYNFTRSAEERNDENMLVLDSPPLAAFFKKEFERVWEVASP